MKAHCNLITALLEIFLLPSHSTDNMELEIIMVGNCNKEGRPEIYLFPNTPPNFLPTSFEVK